MAEHTPGPWVWMAEQEADKGGSAAIYLAMSPERRAYVELTGNGKWIIANEARTSDGLPVLILLEADARLIAAAPDLLDALKGVLASADFAIDGSQLQAAEKAIAKAEGEVPDDEYYDGLRDAASL